MKADPFQIFNIAQSIEVEFGHEIETVIVNSDDKDIEIESISGLRVKNVEIRCQKSVRLVSICHLLDDNQMLESIVIRDSNVQVCDVKRW